MGPPTQQRRGLTTIGHSSSTGGDSSGQFQCFSFHLALRLTLNSSPLRITKLYHFLTVITTSLNRPSAAGAPLTCKNTQSHGYSSVDDLRRRPLLGPLWRCYLVWPVARSMLLREVRKPESDCPKEPSANDFQLLLSICVPVPAADLQVFSLLKMRTLRISLILRFAYEILFVVAHSKKVIFSVF
jgi:hypothetical protein